MNVERYRMVMHRIWADLRSWNQKCYHGAGDWSGGKEKFMHARPVHKCGTAHCVAGWSQIVSGRRGNAAEVAKNWLELDELERLYLFDPARTLADLNAVLKRGRVFE